MASKKNLTKKADNYSNSTSNKIIYALAGNDSVENYAEKVTIFGGAGNDSLYNYGNKVKIFGEAGKDYIYNYSADTVTIDGGAADDKIHTYETDHVTITGGKGNDSIQLGGYDYIGAGTAKNTVLKYASGDGNDTIFGFDSNDTLHITSGTYKTSVKGNDFIVTVGKQKIILKNAVGSDLEKVIIKNSKGKLDIYQDWKTKTLENATVSANNVTIKAPKSGSYITNYGDKVNFIGNAGSDTFINYGNNATISGGKGKDTIYSGGNYVSISGGAGDDEIGGTSIGNYSTVNGGKGNDYISMYDSYKTVIQYANGDGKDTIRGFNSDDTIKITSGTYSATSNSDGDVIIKVGKGSITLKNATGQNIYITGADGKTSKKFFPTVSSSSELFAEENNFATADNLGAIVKNNLSAADYTLETQNFKNLTQENLITFSEK